MRALLFPVGSSWYALDVAVAREVVARPPMARVPTAPESVLGLFNLRGEIVPLFDTGALLGIDHLPDPAWAVVLRTSLGLAALGASGLPEAEDLDEPAGSVESPVAVATYAVATRLVTLIDADRLLAPARVGGWA
jgi:chemotaxis signal transduction protein